MGLKIVDETPATGRGRVGVELPDDVKAGVATMAASSTWKAFRVDERRPWGLSMDGLVNRIRAAHPQVEIRVRDAEGKKWVTGGPLPATVYVRNNAQ